jgi:GntR family transcriptional regulator
MISFMLDPKSGVPFYRQIIDQVQCAIADGRLETGSQLPTVRQLAVDLKINPNTVARAYQELEIRGIVSTQMGSGTFIGDGAVELSAEDRRRILSQLCTEIVARASAYGFSAEEVVEVIQHHCSEEVQ